MAYPQLRSERTSPRYLGPREMGVHSAPPTVTREKRRVWHNFVDFMVGRQRQDHRRNRRRGVQRSTTHPQGFVLPPYAFQSMGYPPPPPIPYGTPYGALPPHPMAYMPPPPPRTHDLNDRSFMEPEFYSMHPESDMRSEYSHQSGSTRPASHKNYKRDNRSKQQPSVFSGASPQEVEEYEDEPRLPRPRRKMSPEQVKMTVKDEDEDEEEEETINSPIKGFDSFMMY